MQQLAQTDLVGITGSLLRVRIDPSRLAERLRVEWVWYTWRLPVARTAVVHSHGADVEDRRWDKAQISTCHHQP